MAAKKTDKVKDAVAEGAMDLDNIFKTVSKEMGVHTANIQRDSFISNSISSGFLVPDISFGGGYPGGRFIVMSGLEGGGKSTLSYYLMREAIKQNTYVVHFDYEGSTDSFYCSRLGLRTDWTAEERDKKPVLYRPYHFDTGEESFNYMHRVLKSLPDANPGSGIPALFVMDSFPSMLPKAIDENDEAGGMAIQARMFSAELKKVKTLITKKNCMLLGINQIREKPGPAFGDPSYEPCGIAPRQFSDLRGRIDGRSAPKPWSGKLVKEECWDGNGTDVYKHSILRTIKNKMFGNGREGWFRLTVLDRGQPGSGIDRVFDTYEYLRLTGQWEPGTGLKGTIHMPGLPYTGKTMNWLDFKRLIRDPENKKNPDTYLPNICRKQLDSGEGFKKYFDAAGGITAVVEDEDGELKPDMEIEEGNA